MPRYKLNWMKAMWAPAGVQFVNIQSRDGGVLGQAFVTRMSPGDKVRAKVRMGHASAYSNPMTMSEAKMWSEGVLESWLVTGLETFGYEFEGFCDHS